ncbi:MAG: cytidine deaminase [Acidimicrobiia bacterium]
MSGADVDWSALRAAAAEAAGRSYSPYSGFPVGAAARLRDGSTISATNVENASYVAGICAETALVGVLVAGGGGRGDLVAVAVTDPDGRDLSPCGRCRQLLHEMGGGELPVNERSMDELLPGAFTPEDLG